MHLFFWPATLYIDMLNGFMRGLNPPPAAVILSEETPLLLAPPTLLTGEPVEGNPKPMVGL